MILKVKKVAAKNWAARCGARTHDPQVKSLMLWPTELIGLPSYLRWLWRDVFVGHFWDQSAHRLKPSQVTSQHVVLDGSFKQSTARPVSIMIGQHFRLFTAQELECQAPGGEGGHVVHPYAVSR